MGAPEKGQDWYTYLEKTSRSYHVVFSYLIAIIFPVWIIFDYILIEDIWKNLAICRVIAAITVSIGGYLCSKQLITTIQCGYLFNFVLYIGVGSVFPLLRDDQVYVWCLGYVTCFVTSSLFQTWDVKHHVFSVSSSVIMLFISNLLFSHRDFVFFAENGFFLLFSVIVGSSALFFYRMKILESNFKLFQEVVSLQAELSQSENMSSIGVLAAGIAHEFGNQLNTIAQASRVIRKMFDNDKVDQDKFRVADDMIQKTIGVASKVIESISYASKSQNEVAYFNISPCINSSISACRGYSLEKVKIDFDFHEDVHVRFNEAILFQTLINLIKNSCQSLEEELDPDKRWIKIDIEKSKDDILILVKDGGPGIPKEIEKRMFQAFTTTKTSMGIGLHLMKKKIEEYGGDLDLISPRDPTIFRITIR